MRFGTDGIRGRANTELTATLALDLGRAAARSLGASIFVVGGDSRRSTPMLEAALVAGLTSEGVDVVRLGTVPTPAVAFEAQRLGAAGCMVSASHNPYHDNGIKLFGVGGTKLPDAVESQIEAILGTLGAPTGDTGAVDAVDRPVEYLEHLAAAVGGARLDGMRLVVDAANGAASPLVHEVFAATGASVTVINAAPNGRNINARCGATDPSALQAAVVDTGADAGIALDGDADRLIAVDADGNVVDGDHVIAICARDLRARGMLANDSVVVTVMTNLGFHLAMRQAGITVIETPVGDRHVLERLLTGGYSLGGEQSGHVIFPSLATTGDGMLTALVLLDIVQRSGSTLAQLAASAMTQMPQLLLNVEVEVRRDDAAELLADEIAGAAAALGESGRILVRPSGTEPLIRVMVEAPTEELAQQTARRLADAVAAHPGFRC